MGGGATKLRPSSLQAGDVFGSTLLIVIFNMEDFTATIRPDWRLEVADRCQSRVPARRHLDGDQFEKLLERFARELPAPQGPAERLLLANRLQRFTGALARAFDAAFHERAGDRPCGAIGLRGTLDLWTDSWLAGDPRETLHEWIRAYLAAFTRDHGWPPAWRAAAALRASPHETISLAERARGAGCCRAVLTRTFREEYQRSVGEFQTLLRVRRAAELLIGTPDCVDSVARQVGYTSAINLYRAFEQLTGVTPGQIRREPPAVVDALLKDVLDDGPWPIGSSRLVVRPG
jgi:AraC-like DNA-binding protein